MIDNDNNFRVFSSMSGQSYVDSMNIDSELFLIIDVNLKRSIVDELGFAFNDTATTEIYTILFVGSVRCV